MRYIHVFAAMMLVVVLTAAVALAQVTGTKTIGVDYASLNAALIDMNTNGVGAGGVIINVPADWTETAPARGDSLGSTTLNASTSASNRILIRKSGAGANPLITAFTPGTSTTTDGIFKIKGTDYVTIDGIDLHENASNTTATQQMEWGYAFVKLNSPAPFDGCQNDTIRNCKVTLARANNASVGIYANNHIANSTTALSTGYASTDANSNLSIYSNTIDSCYTGISFTGNSNASSNFSLYDVNNQIGVGGGNTVTNTGSATATTVCYGIFVTQQNNVKIDNNTVNGGGSTTTTTGGLYGIYANAGLNGEISNNTVTIVTNAASGTHYGIRCNLGNSSSTATVTVSGNAVQNCNLTNAATTGTFVGVSYGNGAGTITFNSNMVTNCSIPNTGTGTLYGMNLSVSTGSSPFNMTVSNNTVASLAGGTSTLNFIYGLYMVNGSTSGGVTSVYGNTIHRLAAYSMNVCGIRCFGNGSGTTNNIYQNNIYDIVDSTGTNTSLTVTALLYTTNAGFGSSLGYAYDNFISDLRSPTAVSLPNATGFGGTNPPYSILGIFAANGSNTGNVFSAYDNTIYLNASSGNVAGVFGTCGILVNTAFATDLRDNIVVNLSTPGSTAGAVVGHARIDNSSTSYPRSGLSSYSSNANNNDFYVSGGSRTYVYADSIGIANGTADATMGAYKTRMDPRELQSFSELPPFVNVAARPYDLHIQTGVATQVESGGTPVTSPIAVSTDYDGQTRNASFPDVGADEFGGIVSDLTPPTIVYTPFNTITPTPAHTLTATITDPSGVPTSGSGLPVLYYKVNSTGAYAGATATSLGSSQYSFSFSPTAVTGDTVFYFVVAQDNAGTPNVGSLEFGGASGFTSNPPAASTPPTSPYWYRIVTAPLSGDYTVGGVATHNPLSPAYATITAAVADLNLRGVSGNVRFLLNATSYAEAGPVVIKITSDSLPTASKTVTIKPNTGIVATISGNFTADGIFDIYSPYIIIDGNNGDGSRSLTIQNTNTGTTADTTYVVGFVSGGGALIPTNCAVQNCNIVGGSSTLNVTGLFSPIGLCLKLGRSGFNSIVFNNNQITKVQYGIWYMGASGSYAANGQITNNIIGSATDASSVFKVGMWLYYADNTLISGNELIGEVAGNSNSGSFQGGNVGMYVQNCTNTRIRKNKIHDYTAFTAGSYVSAGAQGVALDLTGINTGTTEISNNMIYNIKAGGNIEGGGTATAANIPQGICVDNNGTSAIQIYDNSIYMSGNVLGNTNRGYSANGVSACIGFNASFIGAGTIDMRDNILKNTQKLAPTDSTTAANVNQTMAVWVQKSGTTAIFSYSDYNNYDVTGNSPQIGYANADFLTLLAWQGATGKDVHSKAVVTTLVSTTDLHLAGASILDANLHGTPVGISTDFDGDARDASSPFMGADEGQQPVRANLKVFLQGPFNTGTGLMDNTLNTGGTLAAHFTGAAIPSNAVDSITVELRDAPTAAGSTIRVFQPAWLLRNGSVVGFADTTKSYTSYGIAAGNYYIVVWHRNHLAIMSATAQALSGTSLAPYDFTSGPAQAYGTNPTVLVNPGVYAMYAGDANASGVVTTADANDVFAALLATGYYPGDINLSGVVTTADANVIFTNLLISSQVSRPGKIVEGIVPVTGKKSTVPPKNANKVNN